MKTSFIDTIFSLFTTLIFAAHEDDDLDEIEEAEARIASGRYDTNKE